MHTAREIAWWKRAVMIGAPLLLGLLGLLALALGAWQFLAARPLRVVDTQHSRPVRQAYVEELA